MNGQVYISMFGPMPDNPTGLAMSVLRRAQAFAAAGTRSTILIDQFVPDIHRHLEGLNRSDQLCDGMIEIRSMYVDFGCLGYTAGIYTSPLNRDIDGWEYQQDVQREEVFRGRYKGDYREFVWMRNENQVSFVDYLVNDGKIRINRTWFDNSGKPCKIERMNQLNKPFDIVYPSPDGNTYLTEQVGSGARYTLRRDSGELCQFASFDDMYHYWLRNFIFVDVDSPTIISEYGAHETVFRKLGEEIDARLVYTFHSSHLARPHVYGSEIRSDQKTFLNKISDLPALVVLTMEQKLDLQKQFGSRDNIHVIPHHAPAVERSAVRDPNKIVMVGRFDRDKGHIDALKAFKLMASGKPQAKLEIYGRGMDEQLIRDCISELGLEDSVRIMGFTDDAATVFSEAAISLVPSSYEGFCLSMIESMAQGCVPVVYGFKYGPQDIVTNGVDGLIVQPGNISELADSMSLLIDDRQLLESMSTNARQVRNRFTEKRLVSDWASLLASLGSEELIIQ